MSLADEYSDLIGDMVEAGVVKEEPTLAEEYDDMLSVLEGDEEPKRHDAKGQTLRASSTPLWSKCTASPSAQAQVPDHSDKTAADRGTLMHHLAAELHMTGAVPEIGTRFKVIDGEVWPGGAAGGFVYDDEMQQAVITSVEAVKEYLDDILDAEIHIEKSVDISAVTGEEGATGTPDLVVFDPQKPSVLRVLDYKFGRVAVNDMSQLVTYAGAIMASKLKFQPVTIELAIMQPYVSHKLKIRRYSYTEFMPMLESVKAAAAKIMSGNTEYKPGDHCMQHYCSAKSKCDAYRNNIVDMLPDLSDLPEEKLPKKELEAELQAGLSDMAPEELAEHYRNIEALKAWIKVIDFEANKEAIERATPLPGLKVVEGKQGSRAWIETGAVDTELSTMRLKREIMYPGKLVTAPQAEKLFREGKISETQWKKLSKLIVRAEGKPTLARDDDPRPAIDVTPPEDLLDDLDVEESADDLIG